MKFLYARVSSFYQNPDRQIIDDNRYDRTYIDQCSGKDMKRPQLRAMLDNLRPGDHIVVHSLDRLARNTFDLLSLVKEIKNKGCSIVFLKEHLEFLPDENNPVSNLMLEILGSIAEFERELIRARQAEGIAIAKQKHKFKGGKRKLTDYQIEELNKLVHKKTLTISGAAEKYGLCRASVYNYLKNY